MKEMSKWRDSVGEAIEDLDRLLQLLNTTLDLAEAEAGALHMDRGPVDFSDVVRQLVDIYQPAMAEHHHEVTTDLEEHVVVDADVTLLNRVVSNLLENELTHLPVGCRVNIRLHSHQGSAELVIEDNGPGFPPDIGRQGFQAIRKGKTFSRSRSRTCLCGCSYPGARRLANVSDRPGGGAVITLSLPVSVLQAAYSRILSLRVSSSVPKQLFAHVRPEFFGHVEKGIQGYLLSPLVCGIPNDRSAAG